jgi:hypothetical protein
VSDTTDNDVLMQAMTGDSFLQRCRLRFINAAISVTTESTSTASHDARLAFAGALFANHVDLPMLAMVVLSNTTNRANCLAASSLCGGNITDSDVDFQINSTFTGIATARSWA